MGMWLALGVNQIMTERNKNQSCTIWKLSWLRYSSSIPHCFQEIVLYHCNLSCMGWSAPASSPKPGNTIEPKSTDFSMVKDIMTIWSGCGESALYAGSSSKVSRFNLQILNVCPFIRWLEELNCDPLQTWREWFIHVFMEVKLCHDFELRYDLVVLCALTPLLKFIISCIIRHLITADDKRIEYVYAEDKYPRISSTLPAPIGDFMRKQSTLPPLKITCCLTGWVRLAIPFYHCLYWMAVMEKISDTLRLCSTKDDFEFTLLSWLCPLGVSM